MNREKVGKPYVWKAPPGWKALPTEQIVADLEKFLAAHGVTPEKWPDTEEIVRKMMRDEP